MSEAMAKDSREEINRAKTKRQKKQLKEERKQKKRRQKKREAKERNAEQRAAKKRGENSQQRVRSSSIAGSISGRYILRCFIFFLVLNIILLVFFVGFRLLTLEHIFLKDQWQPDLIRKIHYRSDIPDPISRTQTNDDYDLILPYGRAPLMPREEPHSRGILRRRSILFPKLQRFCQRFDYYFAPTQAILDENLKISHVEERAFADAWPSFKKDYLIYVGDDFYSIALAMILIHILELVFLIHLFLRGKRSTTRALVPLQELAELAEQLSEVQFDPEWLDDLEERIERLNPGVPDEKIRTGARELEGVTAAINHLLRKIHTSYQEQSQFVSDASHELRTPIAVIQGYADLLARWGTEDEDVMKESIEAIQDEAKQMRILVEQLLFLARGDTGRQSLNFENMDLAAMLREVAEEYELIDESHQWLVDAPDPVPVMGDPTMLKQVTRILCDNAKKYSGPGTRIFLSAKLNFESKEAILTVQDEGGGIPPNDLPRIFDRFYRADPARAKYTGGTGLGLSIAEWIVEQHDGYFKVLSLEDIGTRIRLVLPAAPPKIPQPSAAETAAAVGEN